MIKVLAVGVEGQLSLMNYTSHLCVRVHHSSGCVCVHPLRLLDNDNVWH